MKEINSGNHNIIDSKYRITEDGKIYNIERNREIKQSTDRCGYKTVGLICQGARKNFFVHRLVLATYQPCENMNNLQVNHKDGNKENNSLENLEWCTCAENLEHARKTGLHDMVGEKHFRHLITDEQAKEIRERLKNNERNIDISREMDVPYSCVANIKNKNYYKNAE